MHRDQTRVYVPAHLHDALCSAVADLDDAVVQANHGQFGLGASVWSADTARADAVAARLVDGQAWVNTHQSTLGFSQPLVGFKHSGLGVEKGRWGLEAFTELQVRYVACA